MEAYSNIITQIWIWFRHLNEGNAEFFGMKLWQHLDLFHIVQDCPFYLELHLHRNCKLCGLEVDS